MCRHVCVSVGKYYVCDKVYACMYVCVGVYECFYVCFMAHLRVCLTNVVFHPTLRAEFLLAQQACILSHNDPSLFGVELN